MVGRCRGAVETWWSVCSGRVIEFSDPLTILQVPAVKIREGSGGDDLDATPGGCSEALQSARVYLCKIALARSGNCPEGNLGLRRAAAWVGRRKWGLGVGLRGSGSKGCRRKWWSTGGDVEREVALMATWGASRWELEGCGRNGVFELDMPLVGYTHLCTLYQP